MHVYLVAERRSVHCRTFDMPARSAFAPRRFPVYFAFFCGFPKREIERIALVFLVFYTHAFVRVFELSSAEFAIAGETLDGKIHVAPIRCIGMSLFDELGHEIYDIVYIAGCFEPNRRIVNLELAHEFVDFVNHHACIFERRYARFFGLCDDFVVDVGVVARIVDLVSDFLEILADYIVNECLICVTYMRFARNRDSACVHVDLPLVNGDKIFFFSGECVVNFHRNVVLLYLRFVRLEFVLLRLRQNLHGFFVCGVVLVNGYGIPARVHVESLFKLVNALVEPLELFHNRIGKTDLIHIRNTLAVLLDHSAGNAHDGRIGRNVFEHHAACAYFAVLAYTHGT